jgi:UDP-N-acetylglucosamine 2-epimerase
MAPVVLALRETSAIETILISTGQHREMLDQALGAFNLMPDHDLNIMQHGQTLAQVTARALDGMDAFLAKRAPDWLVAQGDTTTTFVAGLSAFYRSVPFAHVEAGLRTDNIGNPFPEEFNRRAAGLIANVHFAPTVWAAQNLRDEGKDPDSIFITGNTGIDAVRLAAKIEGEPWYPDHNGPVVLLTTHRRENWGEPQRRIAKAARAIIQQTPSALLVVAMHRNPQVREVLVQELGDLPQARLIEPPEYVQFVKLMQRCALILSDSGGVQEEAPTFGIPVLVLRETTERPEGVSAGTAKLVGTDFDRIVHEALSLLHDSDAYEAMAKAVSPYGDGAASHRIRSVLLHRLGLASAPEPMWI